MDNSLRFELKPWHPVDSFLKGMDSLAPDIRLIVFDLDETLISHRQYVFLNILYGLEKVSGKPVSIKSKKRLYDQIEIHGTSGILDFVVRYINPLVSRGELLQFLRGSGQIESHSLLRPKIDILIQELNSRLQVRICTNGNIEQQRTKIQILEKYLGFNLEVIYCSQIKPKPAPECLLAALGEFSRKEALFIGDSEVDFEASNHAGITFVNSKYFETF